MKIIKRIVITGLLAVLCVVMMLSTVSAHTFTDVTRYNDAIDLLSTLEVIKGYSETRFGPDDAVTRWQMALLISKLVTGNVETSTWESNDNSSSFTDVKSNHYFGSIAYAHRNGVIIGRNETTFAPEDPITLQDGLTMVVRALGYPSATLNAGYPDSYIDKGRELGLLKEITNLGYTSNMTRGHTAQLLYNALYADTYGGTTLAESAFEIIERTVVLTATENMKINTNVSYARSNTLIFSQMDAYGRLTDAFTLDASLFNLRTPNEYLGVAFKIVSTEDFKVILNIQQISKFIMESKTNNLTVNTNNKTITLGDGVYEPVAGYRTYRIEDNVVPTGTKEIIIYGMNNVFSTQGTIVMANDIAGTTAYYSITAFDDNNDGFIDRALYSPYSFGQFIIDSSNKIAIAGGETASAVTITGISAKAEDYVIYSYNPQSKILDIMKVLQVQEGTINQLEYTAAQGVIKIGETSYNIGRADVNGVTPKSDLEKILTNVASGTLSGRTFKFIADGLYVYWYSLGDSVINSSQSPLAYGSNIGVVTALTAYNSSYGTYSVTLNNSMTLPISVVDGVAVNSYNIPLVKGDMIQYEVYQTTTNLITYKATKINTAPTYNTATASSVIYTTNNYLYISEGGVVTKNFLLTSATPIYYLDANKNVSSYMVSTFTEKPVSSYYSIFVSYETNMPNTIAAIYIKPFDSSTVGSTGEYNKIVYISTDSLNSSTSGTGYRTYSALDLMTGQIINVNLHYSNSPGYTSLASAGYYRVFYDVLVNVYPVTETSLSSSYIVMNRSVTISSMTQNHSSYFYTVNNVVFATPNSILNFYVREGSSINGYTLTKYSVDSTEFSTFMSSISTKMVDVIYNKNGYFHEGTYYDTVSIVVVG